MGRIGHGYGSEWHLLRFLGRHRNLLDRRINEKIGYVDIKWYDFRFDPINPMHDAEWKGLEFLREDHILQDSWARYWPQGAGIHNWDAVAKCATPGGETEWLFVEAKANIEELKSECKAQSRGSLRKITAALDATKKALGVSTEADWMRPYYQYCNRVAALHFLESNGIGARLLFIYFCGDKGDARRTCPTDPAGWEGTLKDMHRQIGIPSGHYLAERILDLFLPVTQGY